MILVRNTSVFLFIILCINLLPAQPAAWIVVNGQGPDDNNRRLGIQNQGVNMTVAGATVYDPPDDCVNPSRPTYKQFKKLQSALYALAQGFLTDRKIVVATNGPILGYDPAVPPGVNPNIDVRNPVEIVAGPSTTPVIRGGTNVVTISSPGVSLEGFEITGGSGAGISVYPTTGMTTSRSVTLVDLFIHHNTQSGVSVNGRVDLTIMKRNNRKVRIEDHGAYGVYVDGQGLCSISDTEIRRSRYDGMRLEGMGLTLENTIIDSSGYRGLWMKRTQHVAIRYCDIRNNQRGGAYIDSTRGNIVQFTDNTFTANRGHGVSLRKAGAHFTQDTLRFTKGYGVFAERSAPMTFENCLIDSSDSSGVRLIDSSRVELRRTMVRRNGKYGIVANRSFVTMRRSEAFLNADAGVYLLNGGNLLMTDSCVVDTSGDRGILLWNNVTATIENSLIKRNADGGIYIRNCPGPILISKNRILNNRTTSNGGGIFVWQNSNPKILGNEIRENESEGIGGGIGLYEASATIGSPGDTNTIVQNETKNGVGGGIGIHNPTADVRVVRNVLKKNKAVSANPLTGRGGGIAFNAVRNVTVHVVGNTVDSNHVSRFGGGFSATDARQCGFTIGGNGPDANVFRWNVADSTDSLGTNGPMRVGGGIYISNSDSFLVTGNLIHGNLGTGIHLDGGRKHRVTLNRIGWNAANAADPDSGHGISIMGSNENIVGPGNRIGNNTGSGVSVGMNGTRNRIIKNEITANTLHGISLWRRGNLETGAPVLAEVTAARITGWAPALAGSTVEVFEDPDGEGETYKGNVPLRADSTFEFAGPFANNGLNVTATVTTPDGNTSEFGNTIFDIVVDRPVDRAIDMTDPRAEFLEIGHWGEDAGADLTGYDALDAVRNAAAAAANGWDNFVDQDPDRFYIRIRDSRSNDNPAERDTVRVAIGTQDSLAAINDDATEVALVETGPNTAIFASQAQLLMSPDLPVADNPDDDFGTHDGMTGAAADDATNDRTHRATIHDSVFVLYESTRGVPSTRRQVPVTRRRPDDDRRVAHVRIHVFNEPFVDDDGNGVYNVGDRFRDFSSGAAAFGLLGVRGPVVTAAHVAAQLGRANIAWAQAGIEIRMAGPIRFEEAPVNAGASIIQDGFIDIPGADEPAMVAAYAGAASVDTIDVFFAAPIPSANPGFVTNALTRGPFDGVAGMGELTFVYMRPDLDIRRRTLGHELGHSLDNGPDNANSPYVFYPANDSFDDVDVDHYRRIIHSTEANARRARAPGAMAASGNRILKRP